MDELIFDTTTSQADNVRSRLVSQLWPAREGTHSWQNFSVYFEKHYATQCLIGARNQLVKTHQDVVELVTVVSGMSGQPKQMMKKDISCTRACATASDQELNNSVELVVRLWLMVNVGSPPSDSLVMHTLPQSSLVWPDDLSLQELLKRRLLQGSAQETRKMRFSKFLNIASLQRIGGFRFCWTDNILDHLRLEEESRVLFIFQHVTVLHRLIESKCAVLPEDFLDETIRTIALLLPLVDSACFSWLRNQGTSLDPGLQSLPWVSREVHKYSYWRDRLLILEEFFDEAEPTTLSQWWFDRRKKAQWYTFWVAIWVLVLTIIFGLIQSLTGILQTWKALHS